MRRRERFRRDHRQRSRRRERPHRPLRRVWSHSCAEAPTCARPRALRGMRRALRFDRRQNGGQRLAVAEIFLEVARRDAIRENARRVVTHTPAVVLVKPRGPFKTKNPQSRNAFPIGAFDPLQTQFHRASILRGKLWEERTRGRRMCASRVLRRIGVIANRAKSGASSRTPRGFGRARRVDVARRLPPLRWTSLRGGN